MRSACAHARRSWANQRDQHQRDDGRRQRCIGKVAVARIEDEPERDLDRHHRQRRREQSEQNCGPGSLRSCDGVSTCAKAGDADARASAPSPRAAGSAPRAQPAWPKCSQPPMPRLSIEHALDRKRDHAAAGQGHQRDREPTAGRRRHRSGLRWRRPKAATAKIRTRKGYAGGRLPAPLRMIGDRLAPVEFRLAAWRRRTIPNSRRRCLPARASRAGRRPRSR